MSDRELLTEEASDDLMGIVDAFFAVEARANETGTRRAVLHAALVDAWRSGAEQRRQRTGEAQGITGESGQGVESAWVDDVNHWKNRATVAEAELARLKGDLKMAHVAATNACRVLEDVSRGWGYGGQPLAKGKRR